MKRILKYGIVQPCISSNYARYYSKILHISDSAANKLKLLNSKHLKSHYLRVSVDSGGCQGFQYKIELAFDKEEDDM